MNDEPEILDLTGLIDNMGIGIFKEQLQRSFKEVVKAVMDEDQNGSITVKFSISYKDFVTDSVIIKQKITINKPSNHGKFVRSLDSESLFYAKKATGELSDQSFKQKDLFQANK